MRLGRRWQGWLRPYFQPGVDAKEIKQQFLAQRRRRKGEGGGDIKRGETGS